MSGGAFPRSPEARIDVLLRTGRAGDWGGGRGSSDSLGVLVDLSVHVVDGDAEEEPTLLAHGVHALVRVDDPAGGVVRLAEHLAQILKVPFRRPEPSLLTQVAVSNDTLINGFLAC